jgi:pimeloyl-ACP methyl ester carboxylesterase
MISRDAEKPEPVPFPREEDSLRGGGIDAMTARSSRPPPFALFLHGIGGRASSFQPLFEAFDASLELIAWNAPGYGGTEPLPEKEPSPADYARRIREEFTYASFAHRDEDVSYLPYHVVGQSLGALLAAAFAAAYPTHVATLTLVCPAHGYRQSPGQLTEALRQRIADAEALGMPAFAAARAHKLVHAPETKPRIVAAVQDAMGAVSEAGHRAAVHALAQGDLLADCARIACPVHVVAGAYDRITPLSGSQKLYDHLRARPRGPRVAERMTVIGNAGHAVLQERPAEAAAAMLSFMVGNP